MHLFDQHIIFDVADGQRAPFLEKPHHLAQVSRLDLAKPSMPLAPMQFHGRDEEVEIPGRNIGQRVGPVFEHALVDALGMMQIRASIVGNAIPQDVVMAALDHMDGVDLDVTEMLDRGLRRLRPSAERGFAIKPLRAQPDGSGRTRRDRKRLTGARHRGAI